MENKQIFNQNIFNIEIVSAQNLPKNQLINEPYPRAYLFYKMKSVIKLDDMQFHTNYESKTCNPIWNRQFSFSLKKVKENSQLEIIIEDQKPKDGSYEIASYKIPIKECQEYVGMKKFDLLDQKKKKCGIITLNFFNKKTDISQVDLVTPKDIKYQGILKVSILSAANILFSANEGALFQLKTNNQIFVTDVKYEKCAQIMFHVLIENIDERTNLKIELFNIIHSQNQQRLPISQTEIQLNNLELYVNKHHSMQVDMISNTYGKNDISTVLMDFIFLNNYYISNPQGLIKIDFQKFPFTQNGEFYIRDVGQKGLIGDLNFRFQKQTYNVFDNVLIEYYQNVKKNQVKKVYWSQQIDFNQLEWSGQDDKFTAILPIKFMEGKVNVDGMLKFQYEKSGQIKMDITNVQRNEKIQQLQSQGLSIQNIQKIKWFLIDLKSINLTGFNNILENQLFYFSIQQENQIEQIITNILHSESPQLEWKSNVNMKINKYDDLILKLYNQRDSLVKYKNKDDRQIFELMSFTFSIKDLFENYQERYLQETLIRIKQATFSEQFQMFIKERQRIDSGFKCSENQIKLQINFDLKTSEFHQNSEGIMIIDDIRVVDLDFTDQTKQFSKSKLVFQLHQQVKTTEAIIIYKKKLLSFQDSIQLNTSGFQDILNLTLVNIKNPEITPVFEHQIKLSSLQLIINESIQQYNKDNKRKFFQTNYSIDLVNYSNTLSGSILFKIKYEANEQTLIQQQIEQSPFNNELFTKIVQPQIQSLYQGSLQNEQCLCVIQISQIKLIITEALPSIDQFKIEFRVNQQIAITSNQNLQSPFVDENYEFYLDYQNQQERKILISLSLNMKEDKKIQTEFYGFFNWSELPLDSSRSTFVNVLMIEQKKKVKSNTQEFDYVSSSTKEFFQVQFQVKILQSFYLNSSNGILQINPLEMKMNPFEAKAQLDTPWEIQENLHLKIRLQECGFSDLSQENNYDGKVCVNNQNFLNIKYNDQIQINDLQYLLTGQKPIKDLRQKFKDQRDIYETLKKESVVQFQKKDQKYLVQGPKGVVIFRIFHNTKLVYSGQMMLHEILAQSDNQLLMVNMRPDGFMNLDLNDKMDSNIFNDLMFKKPFKLLFKYNFDLSPKFYIKKHKEQPLDCQDKLVHYYFKQLTNIMSESESQVAGYQLQFIGEQNISTAQVFNHDLTENSDQQSIIQLSNQDCMFNNLIVQQTNKEQASLLELNLKIFTKLNQDQQNQLTVQDDIYVFNTKYQLISKNIHEIESNQSIKQYLYLKSKDDKVPKQTFILERRLFDLPNKKGSLKIIMIQIDGMDLPTNDQMNLDIICFNKNQATSINFNKYEAGAMNHISLPLNTFQQAQDKNQDAKNIQNLDYYYLQFFALTDIIRVQITYKNQDLIIYNQIPIYMLNFNIDSIDNNQIQFVLYYKTEKVIIIIFYDLL